MDIKITDTEIVERIAEINALVNKARNVFDQNIELQKIRKNAIFEISTYNKDGISICDVYNELDKVCLDIIKNPICDIIEEEVRFTNVGNLPNSVLSENNQDIIGWIFAIVYSKLLWSLAEELYIEARR